MEGANRVTLARIRVGDRLRPGFPTGKGIDVMKEQMGKGQCQFEKFDASGGKVETVFSCSPGAGMTLKAVSKGEYSATGSKVSVTSDMAVPGGKTIHVEQTITMERIGDCT